MVLLELGLGLLVLTLNFSFLSFCVATNNEESEEEKAKKALQGLHYLGYDYHLCNGSKTRFALNNIFLFF